MCYVNQIKLQRRGNYKQSFLSIAIYNVAIQCLYSYAMELYISQEETNSILYTFLQQVLNYNLLLLYNYIIIIIIIVLIIIIITHTEARANQQWIHA